jgi:SpoVK/Ycf46/Vps4 family AAA+-type ATPase
VLFEMPGVAERERIWQVQIHPTKTPLAPDVDFRALAERFPVSGGDIKNAVLKAATAAATEPGPDVGKRIHQRHFERAVEDVTAAKAVMQQSLFGPATDRQRPDPLAEALQAADARSRTAALAGVGLGVAALTASLVALAVALIR